MTFPCESRIEASDRRTIPIVTVLAAAATREFNLPVGRIWSPEKKARVARARFAVYVAASEAGCSASSISRIFGMDHSSVLHGLKAAEIYAEKIDGYADKLNAVRAAV